MLKPEILNTYPSAGLLRRVAAMIYDGVLLIGILLVATVPAIAINKGNAVNHYLIYQLYIISIWFLFYGWFWTRKGQTLGMAAWNIHLVNYHGNKIIWKQAGIRFITGCLGLANIACVFNKPGLGWHDLASHSLVILKKKSGRISS